MAASTINTECKRYGCMKNLLACFANCRYTMRCDELRNELADKTPQAESDINRYLSERGRAPIVVQILRRGVKFDDKAGRRPRPAAEPASLPAVEPGLRGKPAGQGKALATARAAIVRPEPPRQSDKGRRRAVNAPRRAATSKPERASKQLVVGRPRLQAPSRKADPGPGAGTTAAAPKARKTAPRRRGTSAVTDNPGAIRTRKKSKMSRRAKPETTVRATASESAAAASQEITNKLAASAKATGERAAPRKKTAAKSRKPARNGKVYIILEGQTASVVDEAGLMMHLFNHPSRTARYFEASEVEARVQIVLKR